MNALQIFTISIVILSCYIHMIDTENEEEKISENRPSRQLETYTSIIVDNESYSIASVFKHLKNPSKIVGKSSHRLKGSKVKQHNGVGSRPNFRLSVSKDTKSNVEEIPSGKYARNKFNPKEDKMNMLKKKLHRRHFVGHEKNYRKTRQQYENGLGNSYRSTSPLSVSDTTNYSSGVESTTTFLSTPTIFDQNITTDSSHNFNFSQNSDQDTSVNTDHSSSETSVYETSYGSSTSPRRESSNSKREIFPSHSQNRNYGDSWMHENNVMGSYRNNIRSPGEYVRPYARETASWRETTVFPTSSKTFQRAAVIQRNLLVPPHQPKTKKNEQDVDIRTDDIESDDTVITFGGTCDQVINQTCWMQREVGDVLTLSVKIDSSKKVDSFQVRWMKVYHIYESKKGKPLEIEPAKLPWNMVSGSEGRELRLNPVTNTDIDPNCIVAKVFLLTKNRGKTLFTQLKKLIFRIDIPIIDMGKIYAGEELSINIENFISLPERGNLLLGWSLETKPHHYESLPSNVKVSNSGRTVVLKELKKGRMGVLNCVIYSSNRFAVAKRRFNILKIAESMKRRSTTMGQDDRIVASDLRKSRQCRHVIRRSQEKAMQRLEEGQKPKSRKKRFRRMESDGQEEIDCELLRKKIYSRWVRSLFGEPTTEDIRLMPLEKLFELSEKGDGTLDDEIPHEVHYVPTQIKLVPGTAVERSRQHLSSANCTSDDDCGKNAICVTIDAQTNSLNQTGLKSYCNCRPEYYGDGFTCHKIPPSNHREKRLRRNVDKDFAVPKHLFYERSKEILPVTATEVAEEYEDSELPPKILAFEEEESFLLSDCIDDKDCSAHGNCIQPNNGHPYCKCRPGFRGNGIFCWEIMDYVPPEEHFLPEDGINLRDPTVSPAHLASKTPPSDELEDQ